jgi:hypothetical protein
MLKLGYLLKNFGPALLYNKIFSEFETEFENILGC